MNQPLPIFVPKCNSLTRLYQIEPFLFLQTLQSSACMLVHQLAAIHFSADLNYTCDLWFLYGTTATDGKVGKSNKK
jgi:hypothetical protein